MTSLYGKALYMRLRSGAICAKGEGEKGEKVRR